MTTQPSSAWRIQQRPAAMNRRYDFTDYAQTRQFLDDLAALSERTGYYPDLNFTRHQVTVNIAADADTLGEAEYRFAADADALTSH